MTRHSELTGADIRAKLNHPVVDADGHMIEATFAVLDFVKQVGGPDLAARYEKMLQPGQELRRRGAVCDSPSGSRSSRHGSTTDWVSERMVISSSIVPKKR